VDYPLPSDPQVGFRVAQNVRGVSTRLTEFSCALKEQPPPAGTNFIIETELSLGWAFNEVGLGYGVRLNLRVSSEVEEPHPLVWECTLLQEVLYAIEDPESYSQDEIVAFGGSTGVLTAYPYIRETVQSLSWRSGIGPIVLDVLRLVKAPEETEATAAP
jgi:hypothetical protein